jgi:hypothetical protein
MTVSCSLCGQEWPRDPALEVECPKCHAKVGHYCIVRRPSGHTANFGQKDLIHPQRDQLAMDNGFLRRCPASPKIEQAHCKLHTQYVAECFRCRELQQMELAL